MSWAVYVEQVAAEHLVGHTVDAGVPIRFFEDAEKEIVGVDGGPPR